MNSMWGQTRHRAIQVKNVLRTRWIMRDCDEIGHLARIAEGHVIVDNQGTLRIGAHTRFFGRFAPIEMRTGPEGELVIGEWNSWRWGSSVHVADSVKIGSGTRVGSYCIISDIEVGGLDSPDTAPARPVVIGDGVWIATRVIVRPGSTIGDGSVIGAGSIVDGHIPPRSVAVGSPARVVRSLDDAPLLKNDELSPGNDTAPPS